MMAHPTIVAFRRRLLEDWIERAIALLDELDGDADLETGADDERDETEIISDLPGFAEARHLRRLGTRR
jgi:hypothetical protein